MSRRFVVYALVSLLSACAVTPESSSERYDLAAMRSLQQKKRWSFEGRLAFVDEKDSISGAVVWRHDGANEDIELVGPLAQGRLRISVADGRVVVDDGDSPKVFYGQPDEVLAEQVGMNMPVSALKFWVLGVNDPTQAFVEQSDGFYQSGWLVRDYEMQVVNTELLPKKMTAVKDKTRIKLIVDQWNLL